MQELLLNKDQITGSNSTMTMQSCRQNNHENKPKSLESSTSISLPETECIKYGWLSCRPSFLQSCLCTGWILTSCSLYVFIQQFIVTGISNVVVTSLEKRFFLKSSHVATLFSCFDVGNLILTIIVSYFGSRHKPKWLGSGALVFALGCYVFALPQLITDKYNPIVSKNTDLCRNTANGSDLGTNTTTSFLLSKNDLFCKESKWYFVFLLVIGQLIIGAGSSPIFNLGPSYLDENVSQKNSGLTIGIYYCVATLGSGLGFILGGYFLAIYVDFKQVCLVRIRDFTRKKKLILNYYYFEDI